MSKLRWWLAIFAAAAVPLMLYMTQRQQQRRGRLTILTDTVKERVEGTGETAHKTLSALSESTRDAAESVATTAGRVAERAGAVLAAAPAIAPWSHRNGDDNPASGDGDEDWRRYPQSIGRH